MDQERATSDVSEDRAAANSPQDATLRRVLSDVLGLDGAAVSDFTGDTGLFGHLPELDSMAVATLLTEIEDCFDIVIDDDEVDGEMLETYGARLSFIEAKTA